MTAPADIRRSAVAGMFYPSDPDELRRDVERMLDAPARKIPGVIRGVIAPHAGYIYSGQTAAHGYGLLRNAHYDIVVVVSPSHREYFDGVSVYPGGGYRTPLGVVPVDGGLRDELLKILPRALASKAGHGEEHAIEVQLPFLQMALGSFALLPLVVGNQSPELCFALGDALGRILRGREALLVASTDLSHYYPASVADALDGIVIDDIRNFDEKRLMADLEAGRAEACGGGPAVAVMAALHRLGVSKIEVLHHCNSGDVSGDTSAVVGYLSAVAYS